VVNVKPTSAMAAVRAKASGKAASALQAISSFLSSAVVQPLRKAWGSDDNTDSDTDSVEEEKFGQ